MLEIWPAWFCAALIQVTSAAWIHEQWLCQSQTLLHSCPPKSASLLVFMPSLPRCSLSGCCWVIQKSLLCSRTLKTFIWPLIWSVLHAVCCTKFLWWHLRSTLLYGYKGKCLKGLCSSLFDPRKYSAGHEKKPTHQSTHKTLYLQYLLPASAGAIVA